MTIPNRVPIVLFSCTLSLGASSSATSPSAYPRTVREVPAQFRGAWETFGDQGCIREVSYRLEARRFYNFEASYDVVSVTLRSPTLIVVHTRLDRVHGGPKNGSWTLRLVKDGNALSGPDGTPPYYERCRYGQTPSQLLDQGVSPRG